MLDEARAALGDSCVELERLRSLAGDTPASAAVDVAGRRYLDLSSEIQSWARSQDDRLAALAAVVDEPDTLRVVSIGGQDYVADDLSELAGKVLGTPAEIKQTEYRLSLIWQGVYELEGDPDPHRPTDWPDGHRGSLWQRSTYGSSWQLKWEDKWLELKKQRRRFAKVKDELAGIQANRLQFQQRSFAHAAALEALDDGLFDSDSRPQRLKPLLAGSGLGLPGSS